MAQPTGPGLDRLLQLGRPCVHQIAADDSTLATALLQLADAHPQAAIRRIRGAKSRLTQGFFDEIAAALQFPYYFGENWHALDDCLLDLAWLPAQAYLLVVGNADEWLADAPTEAPRHALDILAGAADVWQGPPPGNGGGSQQAGVPFHVLLQAQPDGRAHRLLRESSIEADSLIVEP